MTATIIDGKAIAAELRQGVAKGVEELIASGGPRPGLATVLVGENPASQTYVRMKRKASAEVDIESFGHELPVDISQEKLETIVLDMRYKAKNLVELLGKGKNPVSFLHSIINMEVFSL